MNLRLFLYGLVFIVGGGKIYLGGNWVRIRGASISPEAGFFFILLGVILLVFSFREP